MKVTVGEIKAALLGLEGEGLRRVAVIAADGADDAARVHFADAEVAAIGDVERAVGIGRHGGRPVEPGTGGGDAFAANTGFPANTRHDIGDAVTADAANAMVAGVGEIEVAGGIVGDILRGGQQGLRGGQGVAAEAIGPGVGVDDRRTEREPADPVVESIGDVE